MSSTSPTRPAGSDAPAARYMCSRSASAMAAHSGERTIPGCTAFTRIGASSTASARVSASTAPQMLAATAHPGPGRCDAVPVVSVIDPPSRMCGTAARTAARAPNYRRPKNARARATSSSATGISASGSPAV